MILNVILLALAKASFLHEKVSSSLELSPAIAYQNVDVKATVLETSSSYTIKLPSTKKLSLIQIKAGQKAKQELSFSQKESEIKVDLGKKYSKGDTLDLEIKLIWIKVSSPFPKEIGQMDNSQMYEIYTNAVFYSPYETKTQTLEVKLPNSKEPLAYGKELESVSRSGNKITYGPYNDIKPLTTKKLYLHYYDKNPALVARNYEKTYRVSYWTPELHVQEDYEVHHEGAKLKGHFSRVDFKLTAYGHGQTSVVKSFTAILPPAVTDVYYKDVVGNISTSNLRKEKKQSVLHFNPRYPLYGGWKFTWFYGYTMPQEPLLSPVNGKSEEYRFKATMTPSVSGLAIEKSTLKVILPEGAENIKINAPFKLESEKITNTFTYFDTTGRPTVVLERLNVVDQLSDPVQITYTYPAIRVWQKLAAIGGSICLAILVIWFISSLELSFVPDPKVVLKKRMSAARAKISKLIAKDSKAHTQLSDAFAEFKQNKDVVAFKLVQQRVFTILLTVQEALVSNEFAFDPELGKKLKTLADLFKQKVEIIQKEHEAVTGFFEGDATDEGKAKLTKSMESLGASLVSLEGKIKSIIKKM